jgi:hypothetical protein
MFGLMRTAARGYHGKQGSASKTTNQSYFFFFCTRLPQQAGVSYQDRQHQRSACYAANAA